jgi:hypothetical protein
MIRKLLVIHHSNVANHFSKSLALTLSPSRKEKRKKEKKNLFLMAYFSYLF